MSETKHTPKVVTESDLVVALNPRHERHCSWPMATCSCPVGERLLRLLVAANDREYFEVTP